MLIDLFVDYAMPNAASIFWLAVMLFISYRYRIWGRKLNPPFKPNVPFVSGMVVLFAFIIGFPISACAGWFGGLYLGRHKEPRIL